MNPLRPFTPLLSGLLMAATTGSALAQALPDDYYMNRYDRAAEEIFAAREADWRNGPIVYQVIVDRFAPPADLEAKRDLYPAPKRLRSWDEVPRQGEYLEEVQVWSHEIDFWGGDLQSLKTRLDYVHELGVDVLYLNPIHMAYTNHKYDAQDYFEVSPEYGTREDVGELADSLHERGMYLMLDGVLNHMGRTSSYFAEALTDPDSPYREWFYIGDEYEMGYRGWYDVANLPEVNHESEAVRDRLWNDPDSVIQGYLREEGVDGWRLDVAFDIGFRHLSELTTAAHTAKPGSLIIGEIWNYPAEWIPAVDGIMNMVARQLILDVTAGRISGPLFARHMQTMVDDTGIEPMLKCWLVLDNHDTPRLKTTLPEVWQRDIAQTLQFTLPGAPNVYYGVEAGMEGGYDPEMRAPMDWENAEPGNAEFDRVKKLIDLRNENRALRIGDFLLLESENLLAFMRKTNKADETIIVVANTTDEEQQDIILVRDSKVMSHAELTDLLTGEIIRSQPGALNITMAPRTIRVLRTDTTTDGDYSPYKRVY